MSLDFLVVDARKNGHLKKYDPHAPLNNFVDATGGRVVKSNDLLKKEADLNGKAIPWQDCPHLKTLNGECHCQKYVSYCAKDKCKTEWKE